MSGSAAGFVSVAMGASLAINKAKASKAGSTRVLDSPASATSSNSNPDPALAFSDSHNDTPSGDSTNSPGQPPEDEVRIPIIGYEVMEERARFTVYKLRIEFKNGDCWFVFRRYTDFVRLLSQLKKQKARISHLSLPRKRWFGDNFSPSFLEDRMHGLQSFVNGLLNSPDLISTTYVRDFFCLDGPPTLADTVEESRAIFEALQDIIYHLRRDLKKRDKKLAAEYKLRKELELKVQDLLSKNQLCSACRGAI